MPYETTTCIDVVCNKMALVNVELYTVLWFADIHMHGIVNSLVSLLPLLGIIFLTSRFILHIYFPLSSLTVLEMNLVSSSFYSGIFSTLLILRVRLFVYFFVLVPLMCSFFSHHLLSVVIVDAAMMGKVVKAPQKGPQSSLLSYKDNLLRSLGECLTGAF